MKEKWADGFFAAPSLDEMAIRNAGAQGAVSVITDLLELDHISIRSEDE